jgi:hypothetical protein
MRHLTFQFLNLSIVLGRILQFVLSQFGVLIHQSGHRLVFPRHNIGQVSELIL